MLTEALLGVLLTSSVVSALSFYARKKWVSKWEEREFNNIRFSWSTIFLLSTAAAGVISFITGYLESSYVLATLFGVTAYILTFSGIVDFYTKRAPYEMTTAGILLSVLFSAATYATGISYLGETITGNLLYDSLLQVGLWTVMVAFFLIVIQLLQPGGMGFADYKIMWIAGFTYAGFLGFVETGIMFTAGILLQGIFFVYLRLTRKTAAELVSEEDNLPIKNSKGGDRTLPLIPALAVTYLLGNVWVLVT